MKNRFPSPLHLAAYTGKPAAVEHLIDAGLMTDDPDQYGYTPLHRAVQSGSLEAVKVLTEAGADPTTCTSCKEVNTLVIAAQVGATNIMKWLIAEGIIPMDAPDQDGTSPLITAMCYRQYKAATILLHAGANAEARDPETNLSVAQMYTQQVKQAISMDLSDTRYSEFEAMLKDKGFELSLPPLEEPKEKLLMKDRSPIRRVANVSVSGGKPIFGALPKSPGATAFFPDFTPPRARQVWHDIKGEELTGFLEQISPVDGKWIMDAKNTTAHWRPLPWYDTVTLVHVRNPEMDAQRVRIFYLTDQGNFFRLNGTSPPIHEVNTKAPIKLNENNVLDYLRFFGFFVRGDEGPFYIAEDLSDPILPRFREETAKTVVSGAVRPASFEGTNEQGHYLCDAVISYSNALFIANFAVQPTGIVDMLNDEPIVGDLPEKIGLRLA